MAQDNISVVIDLLERLGEPRYAAAESDRDKLIVGLEQLAHVADAYADQLDLAKVDVLGPTNRDVLRREIATAVKILEEVRR